MEHLYEKALESAEYIKTHTKKRPKIAVVLGSGLGKLTADFTDTEELSYKDIPNFPVSTVAGHKGALLAGKLGDTEVYAMEGRFHFYEGYSMKEVCYPFYVFKLLDVEKVVLTNACGGINREFAPGTLMLITDFINMMGTNPLIGPNDERFGPRFPDMTEPYSLELRNLAKQTADELGIAYKEGVYMGFMGPCYETAAEIRAFAGMGADAVGMSTVPETMVCNYMGMKVLAVSCITNMATGIQTVKHSHARVLEIANQAGDTLCRWLGAVIQRMEQKRYAMKILSLGSLNYDYAQIIDGVLPAYDVPESTLSDYLRPDWSDACINVRTEEAYETAHEVLRAEGLFLGTSAAAALHAAVQVGRRPENQGKNIVVIVPDNGMKYLSTPMYRQKNDKNTMMRLNFEKIA